MQDQIATSRSPLKVNAFSKSELLDRLQLDRRFALRLLKDLALRLDRCEQAPGDLVMDRTEWRLARLLCRLVPANAVSGWVALRYSPTNPELARTIGALAPRDGRSLITCAVFGSWVGRNGARASGFNAKA